MDVKENKKILLLGFLGLLLSATLFFQNLVNDRIVIRQKAAEGLSLGLSSSASGSLSAVTPTPCLPAPTDLRCDFKNNKISWSEVTGAQTYALRVNDWGNPWAGCPPLTPGASLYPNDICRDDISTNQFDYQVGDKGAGFWVSGITGTCRGVTATLNCPVSYLNQIVSTGQSLAMGQWGILPLSTSQPYENKMLTNNTSLPLIPLVEVENLSLKTGETISSAMANYITSLSSRNSYQIAVTRNPRGGSKYLLIKKGTETYAKGLNDVSLVASAAAALNKKHRVVAVTAVHGEADAAGGTGMTYADYLAEWQRDYETDIKAITGQTEAIPLFIDQVVSFTGYNLAYSQVPIAQLKAYEDNPSKVILIGPKYFMNYVDHAHMDNISYRLLGEYYGKVIKKVLLENKTWRPFSPKEITRSANSNEITVKFFVPVPPIVFDTNLVLAKENMGFEYYDDQKSASISGVAITGTDTVKITLNKVPTGNNQKLRYAYTGTPGSRAGAREPGSARGNLRDRDMTKSTVVNSSGRELYNWLVQFDKPITVSGNIVPASSKLGCAANLRAVCSTDGNNVVLSWDIVVGAEKYLLRVDHFDNLTPEWYKPPKDQYVNCNTNTCSVNIIKGDLYHRWFVQGVKPGENPSAASGCVQQSSSSFQCAGPVN